MNLHDHVNISQLLYEIPECSEPLYSFKDIIDGNTTLMSLAEAANIPRNALRFGLERTIKRAMQDPCDYATMRSKLVKRNAVNIAGFVNFIWQKEFIAEMKNKAETLGINLNINVFPKHTKKKFQNYLAVCKSINDLPEILIGKGFSSLMTQQFIDKFVTPGYYKHPLKNEQVGDVFMNANILDVNHNYHSFGVEEMVIVLDKSVPFSAPKPKLWSDLLKPEYSQSIMQMGKNQRDHFGFNIMVYLYTLGGEDAIKKYVSNVKNKQHFSQIIKNMGNNCEGAAPINIVHQFASLFIPSDVRDNIEVIATDDGNFAACHFFLAKQSASKKAMLLASHLYSPQIKSMIEKCGTSHITSSQLVSGNKKLQWLGWENLTSMPLPYLKEHLSEIAYQNFKSIKV